MEGYVFARFDRGLAGALAGFFAFGRPKPIRLIRPFDLRLPASYAYYIVCPPAFAERPKIRTMRDWLLAEASDDAARLETLRSDDVKSLA